MQLELAQCVPHCAPSHTPWGWAPRRTAARLTGALEKQDAGSLPSVCGLARGAQLGPVALEQAPAQADSALKVERSVADAAEALKVLLGPVTGQDEDLDWESDYPRLAALEASFRWEATGAGVGSSGEVPDSASCWVSAGPRTERPATEAAATALSEIRLASQDDLADSETAAHLAEVAVAAQAVSTTGGSRSVTCHPSPCLACPGLNQCERPPWPC